MQTGHIERAIVSPVENGMKNHLVHGAQCAHISGMATSLRRLPRLRGSGFRDQLARRNSGSTGASADRLECGDQVSAFAMNRRKC